jgi:predicted SprT family Zn-dependent metalloprotease
MNLEILFEQARAQHFSPDLPLPKLNWNSRMRTCAGRFSPGSRAFGVAITEPTIEIASYLQSIPEGEKHIRDTLLHEMIHYYLWWKGRPYGHTPEFYTIMRKTGATRFNTVPKLRPIKHWYQCPNCLIKVPARRTLGIVACANCCKKYNHGQFFKGYVLKICAAPTEHREEQITWIASHDLTSRIQELKKIVSNAIVGKF